MEESGAAGMETGGLGGQGWLCGKMGWLAGPRKPLLLSSEADKLPHFVKFGPK